MNVKKSLQSLIKASSLFLLTSCKGCTPEYQIDWYDAHSNQSTQEIEQEENTNPYAKSNSQSPNAKRETQSNSCSVDIPSVEENPLTITINDPLENILCEETALAHIHSPDHDDHIFVAYTKAGQESTNPYEQSQGPTGLDKHMIVTIKNAKKNLSSQLPITFDYGSHDLITKRSSKDDGIFDTLNPLTNWIETRPEYKTVCIDITDEKIQLQRKTGLMIVKYAKTATSIGMFESAADKLYDWIGDAAPSIEMLKADTLLEEGFKSVTVYELARTNDNLVAATTIAVASKDSCEAQENSSNSQNNSPNDQAQYCDSTIFCDQFDLSTISNQWTNYSGGTSAQIIETELVLNDAIVYSTDLPLREEQNLTLETTIRSYNQEPFYLKIRGGQDGDNTAGQLTIGIFPQESTIELPQCQGYPIADISRHTGSNQNVELVVEYQNQMTDVIINGTVITDLSTYCPNLGREFDIELNGDIIMDKIRIYD